MSVYCTICNEFELGFMGFTGFYWVLPSFLGVYWGFTGFQLFGFTGFYLVFTGFYLFFSGFRLVLMGFTGFHWFLVLPCFTSVLPSLTGFYLFFSGFDWV